MFESLGRWWRGEDRDPGDVGARGPLPEDEAGDWVVLPYRLAEACRLSMYTVASHPKMPQEIQVWMAQWLQAYNQSLAHWFERVYGPDVFDTLTKITDGVKAQSEKFYKAEAEANTDAAFQRWEAELNGRTPPPDSPPVS